MKGHTRASAFQTKAVTGANTITDDTSATAVAPSGSRARASSRFQKACRNAAAKAKPKAEAGIVEGAYDGRPMRMVRAVAFDFNGTLSDDEPIMCSIYERLFAEQGRPMTKAQYYSSLAGNTEEAIIGGWLGVEGEELAELVAERIRRYQSAVADGSTVTSAHREAVRYAAARVPVAVVSGAYREEIAPVLDAAGIADLFATLVTADDVSNGKPHPESYELLLERLGSGIEPARGTRLRRHGSWHHGRKGSRDALRRVRGTLPDERLSRADELVDVIDVGLLRRLLG